MRAGKLDRVIIIMRTDPDAETASASGAVVPTWKNIAAVRAEIVEHFAQELATGFGEAEKGTITIRIRYLPGITTADRVSYASKVYGIKEIREIGRQRGLELRAVATS